jgi:hypothetical protein
MWGRRKWRTMLSLEMIVHWLKGICVWIVVFWALLLFAAKLQVPFDDLITNSTGIILNLGESLS